MAYIAFCKDYFNVLLNPTEAGISRVLDNLIKRILRGEELYLELVGEHQTAKEFSQRKDRARHMNAIRKEIELWETHIKELLQLREKLRYQQREENERKILAQVTCGICSFKELGLQIPNSPITVCLKCIYATVLEHSTKVDWIAQQNCMTEKQTSAKGTEDGISKE
jgi:hypothetical protein